MSTAVRARFEVAQAERRLQLSPACAPPNEALASRLRALQREAERLDQAASVLRRRLAEHHARHRLLDEVRSGRPVHPGAWLALPLAWVMFAVELSMDRPWGVWWLVALSSVEAWAWVRQVKRSRRLAGDLLAPRREAPPPEGYSTSSS